MAKWNVTVDYVTTATIVVEAPDEDTAEMIVESQFGTHDGAKELLKLMDYNVPDGLSVELVEEAEVTAKPDLRMQIEWKVR